MPSKLGDPTEVGVDEGPDLPAPTDLLPGGQTGADEDLPLHDESDLESLIREILPRLAGFCAKLVGDEDLGLELAQTAIVNTWSGLRHKDHPRAYVFKAAKNLVFKEWRRQSRRNQTEEEAVRLASGTRISPQEAVEIRELISRLPKRRRDAVVLRYYADMTEQEVADALGKPYGSVVRWLNEARHQLREWGIDRG